MKSIDPSSEILDVVHATFRAIRTEMRGLAQPELTVAQFRILTRLDLKPHTNKELADWMGISAATMCRAIDVLTKRELVSRKQTAADRREVNLVLTPKGRRKYESIKNSTRVTLQKKIALLSAKEQKELMAGLDHLRRILL